MEPPLTGGLAISDSLDKTYAGRMTQWGLDALFNPAKRHMDEEKNRLQSTRQEVGDASGGRRIDLESGKVRIKRRASDDETDELESDGEDAVEDEPGAEEPDAG